MLVVILALGHLIGWHALAGILTLLSIGLLMYALFADDFRYCYGWTRMQCSRPWWILKGNVRMHTHQYPRMQLWLYEHITWPLRTRFDVPLQWFAGSNYYVKNGGSDAAAGTSVAPWANCPGMVGWSGSATLAAGDTVYFDKASTWSKNSTGGTDQVWLLVPGVSYIADTWGTGTRGKVDITGTVALNNGIAGWIVDHATEVSLFQGFEVDGNSLINGDCPGVFMGGYGTVDMVGAMKRVVNCVVHDISDAAHTSWAYGIIPAHYNGHTVSHVEILNCEIYNTSSDLLGCYPSGSNVVTDVLIRGCNTHNGSFTRTDSGACCLIKNHCTNITVEFNYFHDSMQGCTVESGSAGETAGSNLTIRYNVIKGITNGAGIYIQGNFTGTRTVDVYGNIVYSNNSYGFRILGVTAGTAQIYKIYNNTFYNNALTEGTTAEIVINHSTITSTIEVKNNICSAIAGSFAYWAEAADGVTHNNNLYFRANAGTVIHDGTNSYTAAQVTTFEATAQSGDPTFKNVSNLPTGFSGTYGTDMVPNADGLSTPSGIAINTGAALSSPYNGSINLAGAGTATRPQSGGTDIGAYEEYVSPPIIFGDFAADLVGVLP